MPDRRILFVSHNHPEVRPGGAEGYGLELHETMRETPGFDPIFLARSGPPISAIKYYHEGTSFTTVNDDPSQYFMYTDVSDYDWLYGRSPRKRPLLRDLSDFLRAYRPDVVHFQHTNFIGFDALRVTRNVLPDVPIVFTLHEFLPICHRDGQMVRTLKNERCDEESPRRCHECFPHITPQSFFMRKRFIQSHMSLVDLFIAPSRFLMERFVEWGIPREKIVFDPYGRIPITRPAPSPARRRTQFGFFGQLLLFKGVNVLLRAMDQLGPDFEGHLFIHGANLDLSPPEMRSEFEQLIKRLERTVTFLGRYDRSALPSLMENVDWVVVPSIWWENHPLVIQEAFMHGRPVICSDIGGMAEAVDDGRSGLHFHAGDSNDLARVLERAATTPDLWDSLRGGIPDLLTMDDHVENLGVMYDGLLNGRGDPTSEGQREEVFVDV